MRHAFNASTVVDIPGGFTAGAVLLARSGFPWTPVIGADQQRDANDDNDRAIINGTVAARNGMRQPKFFNLDLSLVKAVSFGSGRKIDLMIQVFNATRASNKNFGNDSISVYGTPLAPVATAGQPLFAPSSARLEEPSQIQLGLRTSFSPPPQHALSGLQHLKNGKVERSHRVDDQEFYEGQPDRGCAKRALLWAASEPGISAKP